MFRLGVCCFVWGKSEREEKRRNSVCFCEWLAGEKERETESERLEDITGSSSVRVWSLCDE